MSQKDIDNIKATISDTSERVQAAVVHAETEVKQGLESASQFISSSVQRGWGEANHLRAKAEDASTTAQSLYKENEAHVLGFARKYFKEAWRWTEENPYGFYAACGASLLLFPNPRSLILGRIIRLFQSKEGAYKAATERLESLRDSTAALSDARAPAMERAQKALEQLSSARAEASAAHQELDALQTKMIHGVERFEGLQESLQGLKHENVQAMRADVARAQSELAAHQKEVSKVVSKLLSSGAQPNAASVSQPNDLSLSSPQVIHMCVLPQRRMVSNTFMISSLVGRMACILFLLRLCHSHVYTFFSNTQMRFKFQLRVHD
eukprot:TRINITY_DN6269_c0_g1_i1.p1 TRINITY_DN6269_c0_g1~~TRINITY_DN6269_c0_g1_i1.p1  ORF type:complete len:323 (+),score=22.24 TRINITY_DN6269_c0_g1_i1:193-1161(+)